MPLSAPAAPAVPVPGPSGDQATARARAADARLARVHLRGGLLSLTRATLEGMAGAGTLDREAMADLAEVRWRSGDLEGAADAARAHQASGGSEPMAALIVAEELARSGREPDGAEVARAVSARIGGAEDVLFALEPRSSAWPAEDPGWMPIDAVQPGHWGLLAGGSEVAAPTSETWRRAPISVARPDAAAALALPLVGRGGPGQPGGATSTTAVVISGQLAGAELEAVDRALTGADFGSAMQRLGVLLRLDPALAPIILTTADRAIAAVPPGSRDLPAIHLVRGDAYRMLGRDTEAAAAYQSAHQALGGGPGPKEST